MSVRGALTLSALLLSALPLAADDDRAQKVQAVLETGIQHARLTLICAGGDQPRADEIRAVWAKSVREILLTLDEAGVKPRNLSALAASRDGKTLLLREGETAADWQARCAAETTWQGPEAIETLQALPQLVKDAL